MIVFGGYLLSYDDFTLLGSKYGLDTKGGGSRVFNKYIQGRVVTSIYAWPVNHPRRTLTTWGVPGILIATQKRDDNLIHLADCKPFTPDYIDEKVKKWLKGAGFKDVPFVAVPDPFFKYNEYGEDVDEYGEKAD